MNLRRTRGIITYLERRSSGYMLRLNTRIWAFVPAKCVENVESLMLLGNTVTLRGAPRHNGRREILYVSNVEQSSIFDFRKVVKELNLTESCNAVFLAYLYILRPSFYKRFITWSYSRQSSYFADPLKFYLNGYLDYHTSKALADATAIRDKEKIIPAVIKYLLEEAQYTKKEYTPQTLLDTIRTKYQDVELSDLVKFAKQAKVVVSDKEVKPSNMFFVRKNCLNILVNNSYPTTQLRTQIQSRVPELSDFLRYRYFCVTGGAGSGKSTMTLKLRDIPGVTVAATTGKAAERLGVSTVHKMLGFGSNGFTVKKLDCEMLVLDEASMLDWRTLLAILKAVPSAVFVGDPKQLPPVEGESAFGVLVATLPVYNLVAQYRQLEHKMIRQNKLLDYNSMFNLYKSHLPSVQLITPLVVGPYGTDRINKYIQERMYNTQNIVPGSRVIINKNIYSGNKLVASNGTIGEVKAKSDKFYRVQANGTAFWCREGEFSLAYALTVHRAQGSEWDYVIVILPQVTKEGLLTEELKQVAFTRARVKTFVFEEESNSHEVSSCIP